MRFSVVTDTFTPNVNGVAKTLDKLSHALAERNHTIEVYHSNLGTQRKPLQWSSNLVEFALPSLPLLFYPELRIGLPQKRFFLNRWREVRPDAVYIATQGLMGLSAIRAALELNIPIVSGYHTNFPQYMKFYRMPYLEYPSKKYLRFFHNLTQCTLVPTDDLRQLLIEEGYSRVECFGRGVDHNLFTPTKRSEALREKWGISSDTTVILMVGRIAREKNLSFGIQKVLEMQNFFPKIKCIVAGDGPYLKELKARFPQVLWTGMLRPQELATHYASADIFLMPSLTETYGNVLLEAMSSGLVTVSFDYAAARHYVVDGLNGFKAEPGNLEQFNNKIYTALKNQDYCSNIAIEARKTILPISWDTYVEKFLKIMSDVSCQLKPTYV